MKDKTNTPTQLTETVNVKFQGADHTCEVVERHENFAIYQRFDEKGELKCFQVFEIRVNGGKELYPGQKRFKANDGAWEFQKQDDATEKFDELTVNLQPSEEPQETETVETTQDTSEEPTGDTVTRMKDVESNLDRFNIPDGNFTSKEFKAMNFKTVKPTSAQVMSSVALKSLVNAGRLRTNGVRPAEGRGRPSTVYVAVAE